MEIVGIVVLLAVAAVAVWTLISPRSVYWTLNSWRFADPEANEPSAGFYGVWRIGSAIALLVIVVFVVMLVSSQVEGAGQADAQKHCEEELLPALEEVWDGADTTRATVEDFAEEHDLSVETHTSGESTSYSFSDDGRQIMYATTSEAVFDNPRCSVE